jgi:hypothetical protein
MRGSMLAALVPLFLLLLPCSASGSGHQGEWIPEGDLEAVEGERGQFQRQKLRRRDRIATAGLRNQPSDAVLTRFPGTSLWEAWEDPNEVTNTQNRPGDCGSPGLSPAARKHGNGGSVALQNNAEYDESLEASGCPYFQEKVEYCNMSSFPSWTYTWDFMPCEHGCYRGHFIAK